MNASIKIVGAGGFLGQALTKVLLAAEYDVLAIQRDRSWLLRADGHVGPSVPRTPGDWAGLLDGAGPLVWMAGDTTPGTSAGDPLREIDGNLRPLAEALAAMHGTRTPPLVFVSSGGTVYGDPGTLLASPDLRLSPVSYYGAGKAASEMLIEAWAHQTGGAAIVVRPSNIYGPGQYRAKTFGIVPAAMEAMDQSRDLVVWGDGSAERDYLHVADFTRLAARLLTTDIPAGISRLHASSGQGVSLLELLDRIEQVGGRPIRRVHMPRRAVDISRIVLDNTDTCRRFGWEPAVSLQAGLEETWRWYKSTLS